MRSLASAVPIARAFAHFLTLANIAEQYHRVRRRRDYARDAAHRPQPGSCEEYHANAPISYFRSIALWKTPIATCDNSKHDCVPYAQWVAAWNTQVK